MSAGVTDPTAGGSAISLPKGGGAISGLGEKFSPDLFTGTGAFSVPFAVPIGRLGLQPQLTLGYSAATGNGPFGLGWQLSLPGVSRKTSRGLPRYADVAGPGADRPDVFVLSSAEDLVPVAGGDPGRVRYRPRTEGLFARIEHVRDDTGDYWEVRGREGTLTRYGTPRPGGMPVGWTDPAVLADPANPAKVFGWRITGTRDPLGNLIRYEYLRDHGEEPGHAWDQPLISRISYADYGDRVDPSFLVTVEFEYEPRPDPFSEYRAGFEIRTTLRCRTVRIVTHAADGVARVCREYRFSYEQAPFTGVSLLNRVDVVGIDGPIVESLPPLTFGYSGFDPTGRRFERVTGPGLPTAPLSDPTLALVDLRGAGLPDMVELGATQRFWRNAGNGRFELPRALAQAPPVSLRDQGVTLLDADGDGRPDLVTVGSAGGTSTLDGYFPMTFAGGWSRRSFQPYRQVPSVSLADPAVKLVDLDGDGLTDVLRSGPFLQCWFNDADPRRAWQRTTTARGLDPDLDLADPRIRLADMTGDGLPDVVLLRSGNVVYWPNLGHGRWGAPVAMRHSPRLPDGYDPRRLLLGDVDGDGAADVVYVDDGRVLLWGNRTGNAWTEQPVVVTGTPSVVDTDTIRLADLHGTGMAGLLFSRAADGSGRPFLRFLDITGGRKPYLLEVMDNHLGATTLVHHHPSTVEFLRDEAHPATRWRTTLPFPVQVVSKVEVVDAISHGRLTTEYRYHHGYWDGLEREFRGFAMVEQLDSETFDRAPATGPGAVPPDHFSPPTLTRTWFHPGPVAALEAGDWTELDLRHEYWDGDPPMLSRPAEQVAFLAGLSRAAQRSALRALRGQVLRTELYAVDGADRERRPYTVTEALTGVREESPPGPDDPGRERVFLPFPLGQRTTHWERGNEPMTAFEFPTGVDAYGLHTGAVAVAVPRGRDPLAAAPPGGQPYLATLTTIGYARRDDADHYLVDRVARETTYEVVNDGTAAVPDLRDAVLRGAPGELFSLRVIGDRRTFYDGDAFAGLPLGTLGEHGLPVRSEALAFTDEFLDELYPDGSKPIYLAPGGVVSWPAEYPPEFRALLPDLAGYVHYGDGDVVGYYVVTARQSYDIHEPGRVPRGLPVVTLDPLGAPSRLDYDAHDLLPVRATDAVGLMVAVTPDYRILQPRELTDVNGNTRSVEFSPLGLVIAQFVRGRDGQGDRDLPSVRMKYDLLAFAEDGQPVSATVERRVHHDTDTDVPAAERDDVIVSIEYSDGFGRVLQTRAQAEDTLFGDPTFGGGVIPADLSAPVGDSTGRTRDPAQPPNVTVSGWQFYDNKGRVVRKYEPFFATGFAYAEPLDVQRGQQAVLFYDPRGRLVRTVHPDGSEQRVLFGVPVDLTDPDVFTPTPWESYTYDANDNAGRTHGSAAQAYADHWNTPASAEVDALGRIVRAVARNGTEVLTTRTSHDIQGNLLSIVDPLGRESFRYAFDVAKRRWRLDSIDAGRRETVPDALDRPVETRDSKSALTLAAFDRLHRPIREWARNREGGPVTLRQVVEYGDAGDPAQPPADRDAARAHNLLGRPERHRDEAGMVTTGSVDFKGNVLESTRNVIADAPILAEYAGGPANGWQITPFQVDWTQHDATLLEAFGYATRTGYDALNRVTRHTFPADVEGGRRELRLAYNRSGALEQVHLDDTVYLQRIAYNAKRQRVLVAHGNGVLTRFAYDPSTFRPVRLRSEPYTTVDDLTYHPTAPPLQDYGYDYDLAGNLLALRDRTPGSGIPKNPDALRTTDPRLRALLADGDALDRLFSYDPIYRLLSATGREHAAPPAGDPWSDLPRGTDVTQVQPYRETYRYDPAGGLRTLTHAGAGGFTREYTVDDGSNRLHRLTVGTATFDYTFDDSGNVTGEATSRHFTWNHRDRMTSFATQVPGAEPSVHAQYLYDAAGQRVKKLVRRQGGAVEVTHYIDGVFEHHRWSDAPDAGTNGQNNHVHVLDGRHRVALVRIGAARSDDRWPAVTVPLGDHLDSSNVVVDGDGNLVNREEYSPYGETTFGSFAHKRYRFTGKERDEESGLAYHQARYLAPYLCRWVSADPVVAGGTTAYAYAAQNPVRWVDLDGEEPTKVQTEVKVFVDALADYFAEIVTIASDSKATGRASPFERPAIGKLSGDVMREDLAKVLGTDRFEVRVNDHSHHRIDLSMKDIPVDVEFKLTPAAVPSKQSVAFHNHARANKRLLVYVYGNAAPEFFNYTNKPLTAKQLAHLEKATARIQQKLSRMTRGLREQDSRRKESNPSSMPRLLPPDGVGPTSHTADHHGDDDLFEGAQFLADLAVRNVIGLVAGIIRCSRSEFCLSVMQAVPTGALPATTLTLRGGWGGLVRYPGIDHPIGAGRLQERN